MKKFKKILKIVLIVLVTLTGLLFAAPYIFKARIVKLVKAEINKNINASVDFAAVDISVFRNFPKVSIGLDDLQVIGTGSFAADTLLYAERLDATVDIMSFIRGKEMSVHSLLLASPRINFLVIKEGLANWDIMKENADPGTVKVSKPFKLKLKRYAIKNADIRYADKESDLLTVVKKFNHSGTGDFTSDLFTLKTRSSADEVTFTYGAIPFLSGVQTRVDADIRIDNKNNTYSFESMDIMLNELMVKGNGKLKGLENGYDIAVDFNSPSTEFKNILSLIPAIYKTDFDKIDVNGKAGFSGFIKGVYSDSSMPGYHVAMNVKDGSFKYPDLPKGIEQINFNAVVDNPDGQTDHVVVDITEGHLLVDKDPFDFRLLVKNPVSQMFVDAAAKGRLDLSQVSSYLKLEKGTGIAGLLNADVNIKGNVKEIEKQQFNNFYAAGTVNVNRFNYTSADYPAGIRINTLHADFTPVLINISDLSGQYQGSKFNGGGQINNLLSYLLSDKPLKARLFIYADKINLNDWMGIPAETTGTQTAASAFIVPRNLNVVLNTEIANLTYDSIEIENLAGSLQIEDEAIKLNNINGDAFEGVVRINGMYSTKQNRYNPEITMNYDVGGVDIQKLFYAFNTAQKLMPVGKFLAGKLTSGLFANGRLNEKMTVDMNTISGKGDVFLIEGFLSKFAPLDKIATALQVKELEQISLKNVKVFFEFANGKLLVKPFTVKIKDIEMEIGGLQGIGIDEGISYAINLKLPRSLMGSKGNRLINDLEAAVYTKGIPFNIGETVNLKLSMGGTLSNPTLKTDLKQSGETLAEQMQQQVKDFAQAKIDSLKNAAKDTLHSIQKQLGDAAKEELQKKIFGNKDSTAITDSPAVKNAGEKTKESVKGLLENILKKKQKDTANQQ